MESLIFSQNADFSTNDVIDWLIFLGDENQITRYNFNHKNLEDNVLESKDSVYLLMSEDRMEFEIWQNDVHVNSSEEYNIWYRRSRLKPPNIMLDRNDIPVDDLVYSKFIDAMRKERTMLYQFLNKQMFRKNKSIGNPSKASLNKLEVLFKAKECGLLIPDTLVTSQKEHLIRFKKEHNRIITKCIFEVIQELIENKTKEIVLYTEEITNSDISDLPETFFPSLFQKKIEKDIEIRVCYFNKKCYSMAIFSQKDSQTSTDFRKYNLNKPNRFVPFKLDFETESKVVNLMEELGLNFGQIDLIRSKKNQLFFLEVNPVGQFKMTSEPCNYNIEKEIAETLLSYEFQD
jgi:ATP-GRASP peptide maturase of grasp-with-spasm system